MKRPYAAGLAILVTLLFSSALGAAVEWVDIDIDGVAHEPTSPALAAPAGAATIAPNVINPSSPDPQQMGADGMPLDYVYINDNATGTNVFPWYPYYSACRFQMMYTASQIGRDGVISQMALFKTAYTYTATFHNVSVKLCTTNVGALTNNYNNNYGGAPPTWVYHATNLVRGTGAANAWDTIDFTTPFYYNGHDNLIVEITWQGTPSGTYPGSKNSSISPNRRVYGWNDTLLANGSVDAYCYSTRIGFIGANNDVGLTKVIAPADPYYAFGDTIYPRAEVKNFGLLPQTDVPVRCLMKDKATGTEVYNQVVTIPSLAAGQTDTVDFLTFFAPPAVESVYVDTMRTELVGDERPTNDQLAGPDVKVTAWGAECLTYNDGTFDNAISWVSAGNELAERFFAPTKPLAINKVVLWLSSFSGVDYAAEVRIYGGGTPGQNELPGKWVGNLHSSIWTSLYKNEIMFDPAISVNYDTFFVSYYQTSITPNYPYLGMDYTPEVTTQNDWGKYSGSWGVFPYDGYMDFGLDACYQAPLIDGSVVSIQVPAPEIDSNTLVKPQVTVANAGLKDRSNMVVVFDLHDSLGVIQLSDTVNTGFIGMGETKVVDFNKTITPHPGNWTDSAYTIVQWDGKPENDMFVQPLFVKYVDVMTEITSPRAQEVPGLVAVQVKLTNKGNVPALVPRVDVTIAPSGYSDYKVDIPSIPVGGTQLVTFNPWVCPSGGKETATAWITYPEDMNHSDVISADTAVRPITTGIPGWSEMTPVPAPPSGKAVKDGGCMAYDAATELIYASKGYKTGDFYAYSVPTGTWATKTGIPLGAEGKQVYKGSVLCSDGNGMLYLTKGNNTIGFWAYDAALNTWTQKTNVPLGSSGKKVKQGAGLAWGTKLGQGYAYLLKGYRNEFHKYDPATNAWIPLLDAPIGTAGRIKWDAGSWLVADPNSSLLYAHKAKYHEMYVYDTEADTWSKAKTAMPIPGSAGAKKAKDGSCAAWYSGKIYSLKGGNTTEFWRYFPLGDTWHKQDDIPLMGVSGSRKKVKAGGALAGYPGTGVYAFKGNKSLEYWRFTPYEVAGAQPSREGIMAGISEIGNVSFAIAPNPLSGGLATVRYSLPKAGLATLYVYDVTGRTVLTQTMAAGRTGTASLDLRKLEAGVYLVKVTTEGFSTTQKLVVEH